VIAARIAQRLVRKLAKPIALAWNSWQLKQSREDVDYFESFRVMLAEKEAEQHIRQMRLTRQRNEIAGW
jgi:hypothetical protein